MQSQLEWGQKKFIKFEMKKGKSKKQKTSNTWRRIFQLALKGGEGGYEFFLEEFWPFSALFILQIRFSNHWLIKTSMIYLYIKAEVNKKWYNSNDCNYKWSLYVLVEYMKIAIRWGRCFCCGKWAFFFFFCCREDFFCPSTGLSANGRFWGRGRTVHTWWGNKQDEKRGTFLVRGGIQGG